MDQVTYQCSKCGFPVIANSLNCPRCSSRFSGIAQGTATTFGLPELAVVAAISIGIGIAIGAKGARRK